MLVWYFRRVADENSTHQGKVIVEGQGEGGSELEQVWGTTKCSTMGEMVRLPSSRKIHCFNKSEINTV